MTFIIFNPALSLIAASACLIFICYALERRVILGAAIFLLFLPFWPLLIIRCAANLIILAVDWLTVDRVYTRPFARAADYLMTKW